MSEQTEASAMSLIQDLLAILNNIRLAPGTPAHAIPDLLRFQAVHEILQDPTQATIPPGQIDPLIVEAIQAGAAQAAALKAAGVNFTFAEEDVPVGTTRIAERATEVIGPFYVDPGRLVRLASYQSVTFRPVNERTGGGGGVPVTEGELLMLIPHASTPDAPDNLNWTLPAGTVWIESRLLIASAPGFTGLRIAGGKLQFAANPSFHGILLPQKGAVWTLSVQPEPLAPANTSGSDADALNLQLPAQLVVHSDKPPEISGDLEISGFGSDLHLTRAGSVFPGTNEICFSLQVAEPQWSMSGNLSQLTQFSGQAAVGAVGSGRWTLPITNTPPEQLGEARHSGSIVVVLGLGLTSRFLAQDGNPFRWSVATLTVNGELIEIRATVPDSGARYDLGLWKTSLSEIRFAGLPLSQLVFRSERGGFDSVVALGGSCVNKWDLPQRADGSPFAFNGAIDVFGFLSTPSGPLLTLSVTAAGTTELAGYAFENLYLVVRPPGKLALVALFDRGPLAPAGIASLLFDVNVAVPTLPDPYAANLIPRLVNGVVSQALRVGFEWTASRTPAMVAHLDSTVPFPNAFPAPLNDPDEQALDSAFRGHLQSQPEFLRMLDLSSHEHLFGVAFESPSDNKPDIIDNRLSVQLNRVRLLLQPQVQWEPVRIEPILNVPTLVEEIAHSKWNGGLTLIGADSTKLVPVLPAPLSDEIIEAIRGFSPAAALFSLPFGLRAMASLNFIVTKVGDPPGEDFIPATDTLLNEPAFTDFTSARQIRLIARGRFGGFSTDRVMPGITRQLQNLAGNASGLTSVLPSDLRDAFNGRFGASAPIQFASIPLHDVGLSGYGLSTFSEWYQDDVVGPDFTKVEFRVLNGRTAYEVIQFRSILYECGARVIRTVILERHNSGRVFRIDTGWVAVELGQFTRPKPFERGAVRSFQNIRRIRITGAPFLVADATVEPVIFDADVDIDGALAGVVPIYDRPGYIHIQDPRPVIGPVFIPPPATELTEAQLKALFDKVHAIGSPANCAVRIGQTLDIQVSAIVSDLALDDHGGIGFAVAIVGAPKLPRAGQWTVVRVDSVTHETSAVDPRRGVPFVRNLGVNGPPVNGPFRFREPSETRLSSPRVEYALMMATETSRALFQQPNIDPGKPGKLLFDVPPLLADPYSLVQSIGAFPRPNLGLPLREIPSFEITDGNLWRIENATFSVLSPPLKDLMKGAGWGMTRDYLDGPINLNIDSGAAAPFNVETPISNLNLKLPKFPPPLDQILKISAKYQGMAGGVPQFSNPDLIFSGVLDKLKDSLDSLAGLLGIKFPFEVSVKAGNGPSPSFIVHMELVFRLGDGPDGRIDIGLGKFYGQFLLRGELEAALTGVERALLFLEFQGDVQQGILPPLLYGGGLFRFGIELRETGDPIIQVTLGIVISIGGDLIPGLLAVEATVNYGYSLIPETLEPGILLGIEARAKLLAGLIGFSFSVEAMARVGRKPGNRLLVTVHAQILVAATVQVAIFFKEDIHLETQFQQDLPLALALIPPATAVAVVAAAVPL
jgi:hypothetical protein